MANPSRLFLLICVAFIVSNCQQGRDFGSYQQKIGFPGIRGQFRTSAINSQQPIREVAVGFQLNPPPQLPFLQSFSINPFLLPATMDAMRGTQDFFQYRRFPRPPLFNLFTPNTVRQRPQSEAQDEEYRKALKEEAEEAEKQQNDITTDFEEFAIESTSLEPPQKTFVKVNVQGKDYSYST